MSRPMEVPHAEDLEEIDDVEVEQGEEPWIMRVTATAADGDVVTLTWDTIARHVHLRWRTGADDRLVLDRGCVSKAAIRREQGELRFRVWTRDEQLGGVLVVCVGADVHFYDTLLRS